MPNNKPSKKNRKRSSDGKCGKGMVWKPNANGGKGACGKPGKKSMAKGNCPVGYRRSRETGRCRKIKASRK